MVDTQSVMRSARPERSAPGPASIVLVAGVAALIASVAYVGHGMSVVPRHAAIAPAAVTAAVPSPSAASPPVPVAPRTVTFRVEGSAPRARVDYSLDAGVGGGTEVALPWTGRLTTGQDGAHSSSVFADPPPGVAGSLTCTILDQDGRVLARHTVESPAATTGADCVS